MPSVCDTKAYLDQFVAGTYLHACVPDIGDIYATIFDHDKVIQREQRFMIAEFEASAPCKRVFRVA
jgi:hypothetical protein